jgi:hypothetical protein
MPWLRERDTMYIMFGPGVMARPKAMNPKAVMAERLGIGLPR